MGNSLVPTLISGGNKYEIGVKQLEKAVNETSNLLSQSTIVNESQISRTQQTMNLNKCDVQLSGDFNVTMVAKNRAKSQQILTSKQDVMLQNDMAQKMMQAVAQNSAAGNPSGISAFLNRGKTTHDETIEQIMRLSNSVKESVTSSVEQYSSTVQSFNCQGSTITAKNLTVNMSSDDEFISDTSVDNVMVAAIKNEMNQSATQDDRNYSETSIIVSMVLFALLGLAVIAAVVFTSVFKSRASIGLSPITLLVLILAIAIMNSYGIFPFSAPPDCSMSDTSGSEPDVQCVPEKGWEPTYIFGKYRDLPFRDQSLKRHVPLRYQKPLTKFDNPSVSTSLNPIKMLHTPSSAEDENLLDMYIMHRAANSGSSRRNNRGINAKLASVLVERQDWSYMTHASDSDFRVARGWYKIMHGQVVPASSVAMLSLSRHAHSTGEANSVFSPVRTASGDVANDSSENVALWTLARIGLPIPLALVVPGVCCGGHTHARAIKIPFGYRQNSDKATTENTHNCCLPGVLKVHPDGVIHNSKQDQVDVVLRDGAEAVKSRAVQQATLLNSETQQLMDAFGLNGDPNVEYSDLAKPLATAQVAGTDSTTVFVQEYTHINAGEECPDATAAAVDANSYKPPRSRGFYDQTANFDNMTCPDTSSTSTARTQPGSRTCNSNVVHHAHAFCNADQRSDHTTDSNYTQTGFLSDLDAYTSDEYVATSNVQHINLWLLCHTPYDQLSEYNADNPEREMRMRAMYLRFLLMHHMSFNVDLSEVGYVREVVSFMTSKGRIYSTFVDLYDQSSAGDLCRDPDLCLQAPPRKSKGCNSTTEPFCSAKIKGAGAQCNKTEAACRSDANCTWNSASSKDNEAEVCKYAYLFTGASGSMVHPGVDNYGRDTMTMRAQKAPTYGQFGVSDGPMYQLRNLVVGPTGVVVLIIVLALLMYSFVAALLTTVLNVTVKTAGVALQGIGYAAEGTARVGGSLARQAREGYRGPKNFYA